MGAELFHADERTGMANLVVAFRSLAVTPKNGNESRRAAVLCYICLQAGLHYLYIYTALGGFRLRESVEVQTADHSDTNYLAELHIGLLGREQRLLLCHCLSVRPHGTTRLPLDGFS